MTIKNDPKTYREVSQPFVDGEVANAALQAFYSDVEASRKKHMIADVVVLCEVSHLIGAADEVRGTSSLRLGSSGSHLPMLARAYGEARAQHEDDLAAIIALHSRRTRK